MHAVIRTGGKQYRVAEGDVLRVEKLATEEGTTVELDEVLLISDGEQVKVGTPLVDGGTVTAAVQSHGRADKIEVIKFKRRKKYRRKQGHRQGYTELLITAIGGIKAKEKAAKAAAPAEAEAEADSNTETETKQPEAETE